MTNQEAVYQFLSDLKYARDARKRLIELAETNPEAIFLFVENLSAGWEHSDEGDLLVRLLKVARTSVGNRQPKSKT